MNDVPEGSVEATLGQRAARGAAVTLGGQVAKTGLQFAGIIVLARMLTPADYGLVAMVTIVVGVGEIVRDFGLSSAAIQAKALTLQQRINLFWTNTAIGLAVGGALVLLAQPLADFFGEERLVGISRVLALTFVLNGMATQYRADLSRRLRFTSLTSIDVSATAGGLAVGVVMAGTGFGYWAIVGQQLGQVLLALGLMLAATRWLPGVPHREPGMVRLYRYGWNLMAGQLIGYAAKNVPAVILGRTYGAATLGVFNRAQQLVMLPLEQINAPTTVVANSVLSKLQDEKERFRAFILHGQTVLLHVSVFMLTFGAALAQPLVLLVLGNAWADVVPFFQILALGGCFQAAGYAAYWVFLAKGLTAQQLRYAVVSRCMVIALILAAAPLGPTAIVAAFAVGTALSWPIALWWIHRSSDAPAREMFTNGLRGVLIYGFAGALAYASTYLSDDAGHLTQLAVGSAVMAVALLGVYLVVPAYRRDIETLRMSRSLLRPGSPKVDGAGNRVTPGLTVLQSFRRESSATSYQVNLVDGLDRACIRDHLTNDETVTDALRTVTFTWRFALTGRYDVLHVHWPEYLLRTRRRALRPASELLFLMLLFRLRISSIAVVRTLHNLHPHEPGSRIERALLRALERRTAVYIRLNPLTPLPQERAVVTIPHGHYRRAFAGLPQPATEPGRLLYLGMIRAYKGVEDLLDAFHAYPDPAATDGSRRNGAPAATLRIVGAPLDPTVSARVRAAEADDPRVSSSLAFVSDEAMVSELASAQLVVLPYRAMHNSGVLFAALSLGTPVLVPDEPVNLLIAREVGPAWVRTFAHPLGADDLRAALAAVRARAPEPPDLSLRGWDTVAARHAETYRTAVVITRARVPSGPPADLVLDLASSGLDAEEHVVASSPRSTSPR